MNTKPAPFLYVFGLYFGSMLLMTCGLLLHKFRHSPHAEWIAAGGTSSIGFAISYGYLIVKHPRAEQPGKFASVCLALAAFAWWGLGFVVDWIGGSGPVTIFMLQAAAFATYQIRKT